MRYKTITEAEAALTAVEAAAWLSSERNEIDWTLEYCDIGDATDEQKELLYESVRKRFITVLVEGDDPYSWDYEGLSILRVTTEELATIRHMDAATALYVNDMLDAYAPPAPILTYKATGRKAAITGLVTGAVLSLAAVALIGRLRK